MDAAIPNTFRPNQFSIRPGVPSFLVAATGAGWAGCDADIQAGTDCGDTGCAAGRTGLAAADAAGVHTGTGCIGTG